MAAATFDTLKFANTLKAAGVPPQQTEAQAMAFAEVIQLNLDKLATKDDLAALGKDLRQESASSEQRLGARIETLSAQLRGEMTLMKWMFGVSATATVGILIRLFVYRGGF